jgi:hypothetical protein
MGVLHVAAALTMSVVAAMSGTGGIVGPAVGAARASDPVAWISGPAGTSGPTRSPGPVVAVPPGTNLSTVHPRSGHTYELASGATYTGTLTIAADGVTVQNAGRGRWPVITRHSYGSDINIAGQHDTVRWLRVTGRGYDGRNGYILGVAVTGQDATVTRIRAYGSLYAGVYFEASATRGVLSRSIIDHCDALNPANLGSGGFGVLLWGAHNTITGNTIINQTTPSPVYGTDGSAVEMYHGRDNVVSGNTGANDNAFTELGGAGATGNVYIGNTFAGTGDFLITRGSGDRTDGPVLNTTMIGNHAHGEVVSYDWRPGDGALLRMRGNTITVPGGTALWTDGGLVNEGRNSFAGRVVTSGGFAG